MSYKSVFTKRKGPVKLATAKITGPVLAKPLTFAQLNAGARACYDNWIREAGYATDARIKDFDAQPERIKERWRRITQNVLDAVSKN